MFYYLELDNSVHPTIWDGYLTEASQTAVDNFGCSAIGLRLHVRAAGVRPVRGFSRDDLKDGWAAPGIVQNRSSDSPSIPDIQKPENTNFTVLLKY